MKVSTYSTGFFGTFQHNKSDDIWDESTVTGATVVWDPNWCAIKCQVTSTVGSKVIRQTRNVMRYVPGRPAEFSNAYFWGTPVLGVRKRIGQFDERNGFFLEQDVTGEYFCVIRSSTSGAPIDIRVSRSNWNGDKLDGTGLSGLVLNKNATQVLVVDYEWYGAGVVKFSFVINNETVFIHTFYSANILVTPWCSTPFTPMRLEVENVSSSQGDYMYQVSQCHSQEASSDNLGRPLSISTPNGGITLTASGTFYPVLSIRIKSTTLNAVVVPQSFQVSTTDNTFLFYKVVVNATLTNASFTSHPLAESSVQYDTSATAFTGGINVYEGFVSSSGANIIILNSDQQTGNFQLGRSSLGTVSDILTIVVSATNSNKTGVASLNWIEQR